MMKRRAIFFVLSGLVLTACITIKPIHYKDDKAVAVDLVRRFRALYNERNFAGAYALLSPRLAAETSKNDFIAQMQKLQAENGLFVQGKEVKSEIIPLAAAREVRLLYDSEFEKTAFNEGYVILADGENSVIDMIAFGMRDPTAWTTR
jgi:hypothetical protein